MRWWFVALLPACGSPADSKPVEYGLRNQDWDGDGYDRPDDCNDSDPEAFPGAVERCNGIDDDCDDAIDDDIAVTYYRDRDGDGWGAIGTSFDICWHPDGYVEQAGDCDDADAAISPSAVEICDIEGIDDDCNALVNEADPGVIDAQPAYVDADNDGFGVGPPDSVLCFATPGLSIANGDCDDTTAERSPERIEVCDAAEVDEDCDLLADDVDPEGPWQAIAWFVDADGDGFGDPATGPAWFCDGAPPGWVADGSDCDDGQTTAYPNHYEDCDDGLDNDCDGTPDDCGPIPAVDLAGAALLLRGESSGALFGGAVSWSDIDGDGAPELLIGAPWESAADSRSGAVHVVPASLRGEYDASDAETAILEGDGNNQCYGGTVSGIPDEDGDGYGGMAVGTWGLERLDAVWIFGGPFGSSTVAQDAADAQLELGRLEDQCSWAYAYGDLNQDGTVDHVVGCPSSSEGRAHLVLGPVSGTVDASNGVLRGESEGDSFGASIAVLGDTDGDGTDDVAIGARLQDIDDGAVFVVSGTDFVDADADVATVASGALYGFDRELLGSALAAGDVNGDGYADLLVTAPGAPVGGETNAGRVYGIFGPIDDSISSADLRFDGEDRDDQFGFSIAANGDVNGDGWPDMIVGAVGADHSPVSSGQLGGAYLFYGPMSGGTTVATDARVRFDGQSNGDWSGASVTLVPDVSADGRADVVIGARYRRDPGAVISQNGGAYLVTSEGL